MRLLRFLAGGAGGGSAVADFGLLVLRLAIGFGLMQHGWSKLPPSAGLINNVERLGFPEPIVFAWAAGLSEFLGGISVAIGALTRMGAFFALCVMLVALGGVHRNDPFARAELAFVYGAAIFCVLLMGSGRYAIDKAFSRPQVKPMKRSMKRSA